MDTTDRHVRGTVSEVAVEKELLDLGYVTARPTIDVGYDLIVDDGETLHRVQVKRGYKRQDGALAVELRRFSHGEPSEYDDHFDAVAVHNPVEDEVYWLWEEDCPATQAKRKVESWREDAVGEVL